MVGLATVPALLMALPALGVMFLNRSGTWGLASFFVGTVTLAAFLAYFDASGYTWDRAACTAILPVLVGIIHYRSQKRAPVGGPRLRAD